MYVIGAIRHHLQAAPKKRYGTTNRVNDAHLSISYQSKINITENLSLPGPMEWELVEWKWKWRGNVNACISRIDRLNVVVGSRNRDIHCIAAAAASYRKHNNKRLASAQSNSVLYMTLVWHVVGSRHRLQRRQQKKERFWYLMSQSTCSISILYSFLSAKVRLCVCDSSVYRVHELARIIYYLFFVHERSAINFLN